MCVCPLGYLTQPPKNCLTEGCVVGECVRQGYDYVCKQGKCFRIVQVSSLLRPRPPKKNFLVEKQTFEKALKTLGTSSKFLVVSVGCLIIPTFFLLMNCVSNSF